MIHPSKSPTTMLFGATTEPYSPQNPHKGTDFAYIPDNRIYAPFDGKVIVKPLNGNDGNAIYMTDPEGRLHGFLHMSQFLVIDGQQVQDGQIIGLMGNTGFAEGVHLHWAVKQNNAFIDPLSIVTEEQEPMFNEGDRKNVNDSLYGTDKGFHEDAVGKPWKQAMDVIFRSDEYRNEHFVNDGDTYNRFRFFAGREPTKFDLDFHRGLVHKADIENLMVNQDVKAHQGNSVNRDNALDYVSRNLK